MPQNLLIIDLNDLLTLKGDQGLFILSSDLNKKLGGVDKDKIKIGIAAEQNLDPRFNLIWRGSCHYSTPLNDEEVLAYASLNGGVILYRDRGYKYDLECSQLDTKKYNQVLFLSSDRQLCADFRERGCDTAALYSEGDLQVHSLLSCANHHFLKKQFYFDIDNSLLNRAMSLEKQKTILHETVVRELIVLKEVYPDAEFIILTSRVRKDEGNENSPTSLASINRVLLERIGFRFSRVIYTSQYKEVDGIVKRVAMPKIEFILKEIRENSGNMKIIYFEDSRHEIRHAILKVFTAELEKVDFKIIQVRQRGDLTKKANDRLCRFLEFEKKEKQALRALSFLFKNPLPVDPTMEEKKSRFSRGL
ncbi:CBU_1676 family Dot/Icm T4SS effector [Coxiella burnetii]|uniref:Hypothetical cytosolic protein n=2 Tax=Coxiella burnetii TaxID=777 RepID=Q83B42_COXBU|nr:CBU_1676 family Dot/Icm T4SS effector [Coxiella burnetii]NP_820658.1 hypothetical protein CBU_1676 [Coxiella burnetii RSA 493]AAO91172.1 hypothetical cytosolic protein [Coxiella burnetii RSA 493]ARI66432.1 hypothetical protein B7L74_08605 [Coxiella burnetii]ARK27883.1 hypothetical protein BMW92_08380 [Coxiella burnetii]MCF2093977.1 CBU_1676 family Dot/Icm T4SS effector [Coxiella burnetii]MCF2095749.1 CBU_1676 family Dot/Icm T4SS effector [Coxiella burnetii]